MPSYRVTVDVLDLRAGVAPQEVLPAAESILAKTHVVEDLSLDVADAGSPVLRPQLNLRFIVPTAARQAEDAEAEAVVRLLVGELDAVAVCGTWRLRRGPGRRWVLGAAGAPPA